MCVLYSTYIKPAASAVGRTNRDRQLYPNLLIRKLFGHFPSHQHQPFSTPLSEGEHTAYSHSYHIYITHIITWYRTRGSFDQRTPAQSNIRSTPDL